MIPCVQWAQADPSDYVHVQDWVKSPAKPDPTGQVVTIDDAQGWVNSICVQGVVLQGDHYAVEKMADGLRVSVWWDDPARSPVGTRTAHVWEFMTVAMDEAMGGAYNTRQNQTVYADNPREVAKRSGLSRVKSWSDFRVPPREIVRHGVTLGDSAYEGHSALAIPKRWREWLDGLPAGEVVNGKLRSQRRAGRYLVPDGTRTYFMSDTALTNGIHSADNELASLLTTSAEIEVGGTAPAGSDDFTHVFVSPANEPDNAAWPTGNYRAQLDCTAVGGNITFGLLTLGGSAGHFGRVNAAITSDLETKQQAEGAFSGTGLKLATTGSVSWSSGSATDRFENLVAAANSAAHGTQSLDLELNGSDDFVDGPWAAAGGVQQHPVTVGTAF